jgi:hypothetical protein
MYKKDKLDHLEEKFANSYSDLVSKVNSGSGTVIQNPA